MYKDGDKYMDNKIIEILTLYKDCDEKIQYIIIDTLNYYYQKNTNQGLELAQLFINIKKIHPKFNIRLATENEENSFFTSFLMQIVLKESGLTYETVLHEMTHAVHYILDNYKCPPNIKNMIVKLKANPEFEKIAVEYINNCQKTIDDNRENLKKDILLNNIKNNHYKRDESLNIIDGETMDSFADIIDAIYEGKVHDCGLVYIRDINTNSIKSPQFGGHGIDYYTGEGGYIEDEKINIAFMEILANIIPIIYRNDTNALNELITLFGSEFIETIYNYYQELTKRLLNYQEDIIDKSSLYDIDKNNIHK